jgi:hypothetical protein
MAGDIYGSLLNPTFLNSLGPTFRASVRQHAQCEYHDGVEKPVLVPLSVSSRYNELIMRQRVR